jgi:hypothetical protein
MQLKIFSDNFKESDFNDFIASHIVIKINFLQDGRIYILWKPLNAIGNDRMDIIDKLDAIVKQAEVEAMGAAMDRDTASSEIADYKTAMSKYGPNQKEYKVLEEKIAASELQIKMSDETIAKRNLQILGAKERNQQIINQMQSK